jgi:hypothetical protein
MAVHFFRRSLKIHFWVFIKTARVRKNIYKNSRFSGKLQNYSCPLICKGRGFIKTARLGNLFTTLPMPSHV